MTFIVGAIIAVGAGVAATVGSIVVAIGAAVGAVIGPIVATVGSIVSGVVSTVAAVIGPILSGISSIAQGILQGVTSTLQGVVTAVKGGVASITQGLNTAIIKIGNAITKPLAPILTPISHGLTTINTALKGIDFAVTNALGPFAGVVKLITTISNVKLLYGMLTGQTDVLTAIKAIAKNTQLGTMQAIAQLSLQTISMGVDIMNKVDNQFDLMAAAIDTFDERIKTSAAELQGELNAQIASTITPRLNTLGAASTSTNRQVAAIYRRLEDKPWFEAMLFKVLP
jgi:phage-related protein